MRYDHDIICCGYTLCQKNWGMTDVSEVFHRIYYVYAGEAYYKSDDKIIQLKPGNLYILPIMHAYTMWQNPERPLDVLWFHVEMNIQLCTDIIAIEINKDDLLGYLLAVMRILSETPSCLGKILKIFDVFLELLCEKIQIEPYPGKEMCEILQYIDTHKERKLSVKELASHVGMERSYFGRKFKSVFQMSPEQFLTAKKMKMASRELIKGSSVCHTAKVAGYTNEKAFSRAFKRYIGVSPGKYKELYTIQP